MVRHSIRFTDYTVRADQLLGPWISAENYFKINIGQNGLAGDYRLKLKNPGRNFQNVEFQLLKKSPSSSLKGSVSFRFRSLLFKNGPEVHPVIF